MQWTMPPRVLQIVAALIGLAAASSFVLGIVNAPQRGGRLPGEKAPAAADVGAAAPIDAAEAMPLGNERIEGPPPPTPEEIAKAKAEAEAKKLAEAEAKAAAEQAAMAQAMAGNAATPTNGRPVPAAPETAAPSQTLGGPPAADEPPY